MARVLHKIIIGQELEPEPEPKPEPAQIPMPAFRVTGMPVVKVAPVTSIAVNGSKQAVFKIKPKGGVIHE